MAIVEVLGWAAALLTFLTYSQKTMLRLRVLAILSNICFVIWSLDNGIYPTLALHVMLFPMNVWRLFEILRMKHRAVAARENRLGPLDWLRPLAKTVTFEAGDFIFHKGDRPDHLYYLVEGEVAFDDVHATAGAGEIFGEVAFLTSQKARTSSARCTGRCVVMALDAADLATMSLQDPAFNIYIMRVIAERLARRPAGDVPHEPPFEPAAP